MPDQTRGRAIVADHARLRKAIEPKLLGFVPALNQPIEGANQTNDKPGTTLNRAGSSASNPILSGLGQRFTGKLNSGDVLRSVHVFQNPAALGSNLVALANAQAAGVFTIDLVAGMGATKAGSPATTAIKNFIRWTSERGTIQKEFYIKRFDFDVVALDGKPALDPITFLKSCIQIKELPGGVSFLQVNADWMVSWNDEFGALHRRSPNPFVNAPGYLKSYGGAKFVSVFDTSTATEGVGVEVNPQTQIEIKDLHEVEVENTPGQKDFTVRFRSKKESVYFVDVDVCVLVIADPCAPSDPPVTEDPPTDTPTTTCETVPPDDPPIIPVDLPADDTLPTAIPGSPESPTIPVAYPDALGVKMVVLTIQGQTTGNVPNVIVRRFSAAADSNAPGGFKLAMTSRKTYVPLVVAGATTPTKGAPYQAAQAYRVAFQYAEEQTDAVVFYTVQLEDGGLLSQALPCNAPAVLNLSPLFALEQGNFNPTPPT